MRKLVIFLAPLLALASCGENGGWNPNYSAMHNGSGYAGYMNQREAALQGRGAVPPVIPVELPAQAPTATDLSGLPIWKQPGGGKAQRVVVAPDLRGYARRERQAPGTEVYRRTGGTGAAASRNCAGYPSADAAQRAFIAAGGPVLDPRGMDPDGDGFACGWDPRPLR
ncbi:MAG: hypothetical protein QM682_11470 [Paracoccus sp. (in: a-proteobacteria)]|uniref:hypothetical protein n=1 Tax=Paracoccus sp. TaxID=267 RepID=UPI0039E3282D